MIRLWSKISERSHLSENDPPPSQEENEDEEIPGTATINNISSAGEELHDKETLPYVLGSIIRRLECRKCSELIRTLQDSTSATRFTAEMLF